MMGLDKLLFMIIGIGIVLGGIDHLRGNKLGLGQKFVDGLNAMGPLALGMAGMICLAPVISSNIKPLAALVYNSTGVDPALFGGLLSSDMGGYPLAMELAKDPSMALYAGLNIGTTLGCTLVFLIPLGLSIISDNDLDSFAKGIMLGIIPMPIGAVAGGLAAGFPLGSILYNTVPVLLLLSLLLAVGLLLRPRLIIAGCLALGKLVSLLGTLGLVAAGFTQVTGITIIAGMEKVDVAMKIVDVIAVFLMGALPIMSLVTKAVEKRMDKKGGKAVNKDDVFGFGVTLVNPLPTFMMLPKMTEAGKVKNIAFMVSASCTFGDYLGFTAGVEPGMTIPVIAGKLVGALLALWVANRYTAKENKKS